MILNLKPMGFSYGFSILCSNITGSMLHHCSKLCSYSFTGEDQKVPAIPANCLKDFSYQAILFLSCGTPNENRTSWHVAGLAYNTM
jgi:hypothetical protein